MKLSEPTNFNEVERELSPEVAEHTLRTLQNNFNANMHLHEGCEWDRVEKVLKANPEALWSINQMEAQGHMPNVYNFDHDGFDIGTCSEATPEKTRFYAYDQKAAALFKKKYPHITCKEGAVEMAGAMGISLMSLNQYTKQLHTKVTVDSHSCTWLFTDTAHRAHDLAILAGYDYDEIYLRPVDACYAHNTLGWRGSLRIPWAPQSNRFISDIFTAVKKRFQVLFS